MSEDARQAPVRVGLCLDIPIGRFTVQIVVPRDITTAEAKRLCAIISTLPMDDEP